MLIPYGGGSRVHIGGPIADWTALSTERLTGIVRYDPADLVVTVRAGTPWREMQSALAERGQWLPWEPEFGGPTTFGGALATNMAGGAQDGFGTPRDRILQLTAATGYGKKITAGAPVVKSVAGYDIHRLFCGSWGTLGLILEATVRTEPMAEWRSLTVRCSGWDEVLERAFAADSLGGTLVTLRFECGDDITATYNLWGSDKAVNWALAEVAGQIAEAIHERAAPAERLRFVSTLADSVAFAEMLKKEFSKSFVTFRPVSGVIWLEGHDIGPATEMADARGIAWRREVGEGKSWSDPTGALGLMRQIKKTFDPHGIFNPGRFVGGI